MDEFEEAVLCSYNPNVAGNIKANAIEYCNKVLAAKEGWAYCLDKFYKTTRIEVKFFCLTVLQDVILHRYVSLTSEERTRLKTGLWRYLVERIPKHTEEPAVKNKYAQILALLFRVEYPQDWPSFFSDLLGTMSISPLLVEMFLKVMKTIDEEVVDREIPRNTTETAHVAQIKDNMRDSAVKSLVSAWYNILLTYQSSSMPICNDCLDNVKRYTGWIDINLIANDSFLTLIFKFLSVNALRDKACEVLYEIVSKGMDHVLKVTLLSKLKLGTVFSSINMNDDVDYLDKVAAIVNVMGTELITAHDKISTWQMENKGELIATTRALLDEALGLMFRFLAHEDDDVSSAVFNFAGSYLNSLKNVQISQVNVQHFTLFLQIIRSKLKYEDDFDINKKGEENAEIKDYRQSLLALYKHIARLNPQLVAEFVHSTTVAAITNFDKVSFSDVEVALTLFYTMGEGKNKYQKYGAILWSNDQPDLSEQYLVYSSRITLRDLSTYPHPSVALVYFDTIVRYSKYFPSDPEVLKNILISFLDGRGIRHPHATVRSRICYLFQRLVKIQLLQCQPFIPSIINSLKEFLVISAEVEKIFSFEEQLHLFDAAGLLVGSLPNALEQRKYLEEILTPILKQGHHILFNRLYQTDTPERPVFTTLLLHSITAAGSFSKGFTTRISESTAVFKEFLNFTVLLFQAMPNNEEVRTKMMFFMHRMIDCLGDDVIAYAASLFPQVLVTCDHKDLNDLVRLVNQCCTKFKEKMFTVIDSLFGKLIQTLFSHIGRLSPQNNVIFLTSSQPISDLERDAIELQKSYFAFLVTIVSNNLITVLNSPANLPLLNQVVKTIVEGCTANPDSVSIKTCYQILRRLIESWCTPEITSGFNTFIVGEVTPLLVKQPFKKEFDLNDAGVTNVLQEILAIQQLVFAKCGKASSDVLRTTLAQLGLSQDTVESYIQNLESGSLKQFKTFAMQLANSYKKRSG